MSTRKKVKSQIQTAKPPTGGAKPPSGSGTDNVGRTGSLAKQSSVPAAAGALRVPEAPAAEQIQGSSPVREKIALNQIDLLAGTESRPLNPALVRDYAEEWKRGTKFPPVVLYQHNGKYFLADGFHRVAAAVQAGLSGIEAEVFQGGRLEALKKSLGSNHTHGQRRTRADKVYAVNKAFQEFHRESDRIIAEICRVSPTFVGRCRKALVPSSTVHVDSWKGADKGKRRGRDGRTRRVPKRSQAAKAQTDPTTGLPSQAAKGASASKDGGARNTGDRLLHLRQCIRQAELQIDSALEEAPDVYAGVRQLLHEHLKWCRCRWIPLTGEDKWPDLTGYDGTAISD